MDRETQKYTKMNEAGYHLKSPGLDLVDVCRRELFDESPKSLTYNWGSVCDWGCGDGSAIDKISNEWVISGAYGVDLVECDIASASTAITSIQHYTTPVGWPEQFDLSYCCDVLEHLQPHDVTPSLEVIREHTKGEAFFSIASAKDECGKRIGKTLHLTVEPVEFWFKQLYVFWDRVEWFCPELSKPWRNCFVCR